MREVYDIGEENDELKKLIAKVIDGDSEAFCKLCEDVSSAVYYRTARGVGNHLDAEDISQEVMLYLCENIHELHSPEIFLAWLNKTIIARTNSFLKKRKRHDNIVVEEEHDDTIVENDIVHLPEYSAEKSEMHGVVIDAINELPLRQRQTIMLYYYDGLNVNEIAEVMEAARPTVSVHMKRAREAIKSKVNKVYNDELLEPTRAMSFSAVMMDMLNNDAANFVIPNAQWLPTVVEQCREVILAGTVVATATAAVAATETASTIGAAVEASSATSAAKSTESIVAACVAVILVCAIGFGIWFGTSSSEQLPLDQYVEFNGGIIFDGGEDFGVGIAHLNPASAMPYVGEIENEIVETQWWIMRRGSDTRLHEGSGYDVSGTLAQMKDNGEQGEFTVHFRLICDSGIAYRIGSNFLLIP